MVAVLATLVGFAVLSDVLSASRLSSLVRSPINFNRRSLEEFQWKIFLGDDLQPLAVPAVLCQFHGKLLVIRRW